jgi:hypothetical protein
MLLCIRVIAPDKSYYPLDCDKAHNDEWHLAEPSEPSSCRAIRAVILHFELVQREAKV